ncbi:inosine monophosphate dehydrogenase [Clavulina sp. PMI_390]|nr:inosine monophosphate dehydrogenase [Clavulina sp. PMI_390]
MATVFRTPLTRLLGIRTPVVSAAMTGPSGGALAAAVTNAGGFGFMATGRMEIKDVVKELDIAKSALQTRPATSPTPLPIGVGFFGFELDKQAHTVQMLDMMLQEPVQAIWLSFGVDLGKWIKYIRDSEKSRSAGRTVIFVQLPTSTDAKKASLEWDIDVIVLQGAEAGGHSVSTAPPIVTLLHETVKSVTLPVLAAGGLVSGAHLASMLALGASGIVVGTRFSVATESLLAQSKKEKLVEAQASLTSTEGPTFISPVYDELLGATKKWPPQTTARGLRQEQMIADAASSLSLEERMDRFQKNNHPGGSHEIIWAGTSVGMINKIQPAKEIVDDIHQEALKVIQETAKMVSTVQA